MATAKFTGAPPAFLLSRPIRLPMPGGQLHHVVGEGAAADASAGSSCLASLRAEFIAGEQIAEPRADRTRARAEAKAERETAEYLRRQLDAANTDAGSQLRQGGAP